ncbi:hypothetical protein WR25_20841 [Diploscapter pachys]|uniref:Uncharacterized protein n=1 Tax=Diploscapter pachys TaxID=2018661 RepID=A0A2A2JP11_9BILA|nr:hypothetical protein WR25_20841 [Diploscapter pachys]
MPSLSETPSTKQLIEQHMKKTRDSQAYKMARSELMSKARHPGIVLLVGDYGTGKSKMLMQAAKDLGDAKYYNASDKFGKDLPKILPGPDSRSTVVLAFRKAHILKGHDPQIVKIPVMDDHEANKSLARWIAGSKKKGRDLAQKRADEIIRAGREFKRRASTAKVEKRRASINSVEEGKGEVVWNEWKCRVIGSLVRFGASEEKSAALASLSTLSVCEAELYTFEAEAKGHLLIATLCMLALVPTGLTEIELRYLLCPEDELLPTGIRRRFRNLPFEYNLEKYGSYSQVSALRWRYVAMRLEHYFITIDKDCNHYLLASVCRKAISPLRKSRGSLQTKAKTTLGAKISLDVASYLGNL